MHKHLQQQTLYVINNKLYLNITNMCNCDCIFCVRKYKDAMAGVNLKYRNTEPEAEEIIKLLSECNLEEFSEIIFCGFGEPLLRYKTVLEVAKYIKQRDSKYILRVNTNGLADLVNKIDTLAYISDYIDNVSISLNAHNAEIYTLYTRPKYDAELAFNTVLKTIERSVVLGLQTQLSVVYGSELDKIDLTGCDSIAQQFGVNLRIRPF